MSDDAMDQAEGCHLEVGVKHGHVIINSSGNSDVEPYWTALTPEEARRLAAHLVRCAQVAEGN